MKLRNVLDIINDTAKSTGLSQPFIVGGVPRDRIRDAAKEIKDIDLTSENGDSVKLSFIVAQKLPYTFFQFFDDGHSAIKIGQLHIDFSNHFIVPNIDDELHKLGIANKSTLIKEMYSRDFTINTLLQSLDFNKVYDITGMGINDIKSGIIRCPIDPNVIISSDPKRILRAIKFSIKFDFHIDDSVSLVIKKYKHLLYNISQEYVKGKINELLMLDTKKCLQLLINLELINIVPMTKQLSDALIENKMLYYAFNHRNAANNDI